MTQSTVSAGGLLRAWRERRRLSQLELALEAGISQRHLSFVESGRSRSSPQTLLLLAERLEIPLRERNALLWAAGFAPVYGQRALDEPALEAARDAVDLILRGHEPYPALTVDRHWTMVSANRAVAHLVAGIDDDLLEPPVNVIRLSLHPRGLAPRIRNYDQWRRHVLHRLDRQVGNWPEPEVMALVDEVRAYPHPPGARFDRKARVASVPEIAIPIEIETGTGDDGVLSFFTTTTVFGTALEVLVSELTIESFFPANATTAATMRRLCGVETSG